jgi:UDP-galactopyranose mutase
VEAGFKVKIVEKEDCIGGMCRTDVAHGIIRHVYGPHVFHTSSEKIWTFVNRFGKFNGFRLRPKAKVGNKVYSFPINLLTLNQVFGDVDPQAARCRLKQLPVMGNLADYLRKTIGIELYELFYKGYSTKQWGTDTENLPATLASRTPIRFDFNDEYFDDRYQGIPEDGYTEWLTNMVAGLDVITGLDFLKNRNRFKRKLTIFTGPIDEYFNRKFGMLRYRSLRFEHETHPVSGYQGTAVMNYRPVYANRRAQVLHGCMDAAQNTYNGDNSRIPHGSCRNQDSLLSMA